MYIITEGRVEVSASINSPNLTAQMLNAGMQVHSITNLKPDSIDPMYQLDVSKLETLKDKPRIVPISNDLKLTGYMRGYIPTDMKEGKPIGDYVQEYSLVELGRESILCET